MQELCLLCAHSALICIPLALHLHVCSPLYIESIQVYGVTSGSITGNVYKCPQSLEAAHNTGFEK